MSTWLDSSVFAVTWAIADAVLNPFQKKDLLANEQEVYRRAYAANQLYTLGLG